MRRDYVEIRLESAALPGESIQVRKLSGREAISRLFHFELQIVSLDAGELDMDAVTGADVSIVFVREEGPVRTVHGMIVEAEDMLDTETEFTTYRLRIAPRAWRAALVETQEIFMDLSVPEIIKNKLALVGLGEADDIELRLMGSYPPLEFVVQYRETDFAFVCRLAEHHGINFAFEHDGGRDKIVFSDKNEGFRPVERRDTVAFHSRGEQREVHKLTTVTRLVPSAFFMQDYNYRTPRLDLLSTAEAPEGYAGGVAEYAAHYKAPEDGAALAAIRAEERHVRRKVFEGTSDLCQLRGGATVTIEGHKRLGDVNLLLTEVHHEAASPTVLSGTGGEIHYTNTFHAIDAKTPHRPARVTPKPRIHSVLTAIVEPKADGEIGKFADLDDEGRYTVKFYFDTSVSTGKSSRPVRMIQPHAGPHYGMHFPLKAGIEVLIVFVDGDPDRPLIVGAVPNPVTPSPVNRASADMHRLKTASGIMIEMKDDFKGA